MSDTMNHSTSTLPDLGNVEKGARKPVIIVDSTEVALSARAERDWVRSTMKDCGIAILAVTLAFLVRWILWPLLGTKLPFLIHWPALITSAWYGGFRAGFLATILSAIGGVYFLIEPIHSLDLSDPVDQFGVAFFLLLGAGQSLLLDKARANEWMRIASEAEKSALRAANDYHRNLIEASLDPLVTIGSDGKITDLNTATETATGRTRAELIGTDFAHYFTEPNRARSGFERVFHQGSVRDYPLEIRHRDGHVTPVLYNASVYCDEAGKVIGVFAAARDISEIQQADQRVRESEQKYRTLFESIDVGFCTIEVLIGKNENPIDFRFLVVNPAFEKQTGIREACGRRMREIAPMHEEYWFEAFAKVALTGESARLENFASQLQRWYEVYAFRVGEPNEMMVAILFNDITERKRVDEQTNLQAAALKAAANGIVVTDRTGIIVWANPAFTHMTGYTLDEIRGKNPRLLSSGKHDQAFYENLWSTILARKVWHGDLINRRKDGSLYSEEMTITPVCGKGDEITHFVAIKQDISERRKTEERLRTSEAKLSAISTAALDAIVMIDGDGNIVSWNPAAESILGYSRSEILGRNLHSLLTPLRYKPEFDKGLAQFRQTGQGQLVGKVVELSARHRDGHEFPVEVSLGAIRLNDQWCAVGVLRDITERKRIEADRNRLIDILEGTPDFVGTARIDDSGLYLNRGGRELLGIGVDEDAAALRIADCHPVWAYRLITQEGIPEAVRKGHWRGEAALLARDGREIPVLASLVVHKSAAGDAEHVSIVAHDITKWKRAEESVRQREEEVRLLLNSTAEAIYGVDLHGRCTFTNPACLRTLGYGQDENLLGKVMHDVLYHSHPDGRPYSVEECPVSHAFLRGECYHADTEVFWRADGTSFPVECWSYPIRSGETVTGAVVTFLDITSRKRAQDALEERARLAALTAEVANSLIQEASMHDVLQRSAESLVHHLGAAFARIWTVNPTGDILELQASAGLYTHLDGHHARVPVGKYKIGLIAQERKPHLTNHVIGDPRVHHQEWAKTEGMVAFAGHPLIVGDKLRGVMALFSRQTLSENTLDTLAAVANQIALGIERKQADNELQSSEERFRRITTNMLDLVVQVSPEGIYEYVTPSTLSVLGYQSQDLLGRSFFPLIYPDDMQRALAAFKTAMETGAPSQGEYRFRKANGEFIWLEAVGRRLLTDQGQLCGGLVACRDITARKLAEDQNCKLNAELEQKVRDRTAQFEAVNKELEAFAYSVSHDLRAPLRAIDGFSQALLEDYNAKLDPDGQDCLKRVRAASQRMGRLIDDILQLSRMTRAAMKCETVDVSALATQVIAELQAGDAGRRVTFNVTPNLNACGDVRLLEVVLMNLLGNAWKFTSKTDDARIEVGVTKHDGQRAFFVRDNGAGFDMAYADRLFGAFQRLHSDAEFPGTGVGLATVQRIIRRHGGQVWAEATVGNGATFYFTLACGECDGSQNHTARG